MSILNTIEGLLAVGAVIGFLIGVVLPKPKIGCLALIAIPIAMFAYVKWWHWQNPELLRSTSALELFFGPLWPSLGAIPGYFLGFFFRKVIAITKE